MATDRARGRVWIEVSEERLAENFRAAAETAGVDTTVIAVVKANAYGHGAERCSVALVRAGAQWLGVTCVDEGMRVRGALRDGGLGLGLGGGPGILVMCGFLPEDAGHFAEAGLTPVVWTAEQVEWLRGDGVRGQAVHVEVDTGMGRQGVRPGEELRRLVADVDRAGLVLGGVLTHFCEAEVAGSEVTARQTQRFTAAVEQMRELGVRPAWVHAGNSASISVPIRAPISDPLDNPAAGKSWLAALTASVGAREMVRSGIALYGYGLPATGKDFPAGLRGAVRPVMTWKTRVLAVRDLMPGETVGYGATFAAARAMRVALLPVGYADGLRRELSGSNTAAGGWVLLGGQRASIVGRISMNLTVVDVTDLGAVSAGDEVVLLGDGVTADDHARLAGTIPYEILCAVRER